MEERKNLPPRVEKKEAERKGFLGEKDLALMHLTAGKPVAHSVIDGQTVLWFDPAAAKAAPPETWIPKREEKKREHPAVPPVISARRANAEKLYSPALLAKMYYEPEGEPMAYLKTREGELIPLYDKADCRRLPLPCVRCGKKERYRQKLCRACYEKDLADRRAAGDIRRGTYYGFDPERVLYFDLEMTGVFEHDEVLSVSLVNGLGKEVFNSLVRPTHTKRWKRTEKIHGITPDMVRESPTFEEIRPQLLSLFANADRLIAFGTSTDFMHLKRLYASKDGQNALRAKIRDCAAEFSHYLTEYEIELSHQSLSDAMECLGLTFPGTAHTADADAAACRLVFQKLFPHYYEKAPEKED